MIYPKKLKPKDKAALIAPASPIYEEGEKILRQAVNFLESLQLEVEIYDSCYTSFGYLASLNAAEEINHAFADKTVDAVICLRGGYGSMRALEKLDFDIIKKNPKVLFGFSDITALLSAVTDKTGLVTFHGPMPYASAAFDGKTISSMTDALFKGEFAPISAAGGEGEDVSGKLIGGNLSVMTSLCGTPYFPDLTNSLLFIEEVDEEPYKIDRMLTTLRYAGAFERCCGIIFGYMPKNDTLVHIPPEFLANETGKPYIFGVAAGHAFPNLTLPFGVEATIRPKEGRLEFFPEEDSR